MEDDQCQQQKWEKDSAIGQQFRNQLNLLLGKFDEQGLTIFLVIFKSSPLYIGLSQGQTEWNYTEERWS